MTALITFVLSNYSLTFLFVGFAVSAISVFRHRRKYMKADIVDAFLTGYLFFAIGITFIYNFVMHVFFAEMAARFIGWSDSPFQYEVGYASLGFGLVAIFSCRGPVKLRLTAILGPTCFLWGAATGHVYQMIVNHNFSAGNAGVILWTDILVPVTGFVLLYLSSVEKQRIQQ